MTVRDMRADIIDEYLKWLSDEFETMPSDRGCFVLTPFERPDGEGITFELETLPNGNIRISDMGSTIGYLFANGLTLNQSIMNRAKKISLRYGVSLEKAALSIETEPESAGQALHWLVHSVILVTDLIQMRRYADIRKTKFDNEVESFIIYGGATYDAEYEVKGERQKHIFRFHVNSDRNLLIQPLTASKESVAHSLAERWAYRFNDVLKENRHYSPIAVLDDDIDTSTERRIWTSYALAPIQEYAILWSEKDKLSELLAGNITC